MADARHSQLRKGTPPPTVSIIIPMRNEEHYIGECLESVVQQDYPVNLTEILVIDGMSTDSSVHVVKRFQEEHPHIRLLYNSRQRTTYALNIGIANSVGAIIARVDAHCAIQPDYVRRCVETLQKTGAQNVGGLMRPGGEGFLERAIGLAISSPFGIGWGKFHYYHKQVEVDTVYLGAYVRNVFDKIGFYDEEAHYSEDDEFNFRLTQAGGKIVLNPDIKSEYRPRSSLTSLGRQFFNYGFGKVRSIQKHGRPFSIRHLIPSLFILSLMLGLTLYVFVHPLFGWLTALILVTYGLLSSIASVKISYREGWRFLLVIPVIFATIHISYGVGFLLGLLRAFSNSIRNERLFHLAT